MCAARFDALLLDEPSNHIDRDGLARLREILRASPAAIVLVSHDRALLGEVADEVVELDPQTGKATHHRGGWDAFVWGFLVATVALYHGTFLINSLTHIWGSRRFPTPDESRNNFVLALLTMGEGWHNNHHHYMSSVRQGIKWWEIDPTYYLLRMRSWVGIARDLRPFRG